MSTLYYYITLALTKIVDNLITTEKSLLVQQRKALAASIFVAISEFMFLFVIKKVVADSNIISNIVVSIGAGIGSYIAFFINSKFSKERVYINIIASDDKNKMKAFGDYMRSEGIRVLTIPTYGDEIDNKTLTALVLANTRNQSKLIDKYIENNSGFDREVR